MYSFMCIHFLCCKLRLFIYSFSHRNMHMQFVGLQNFSVGRSVGLSVCLPVCLSLPFCLFLPPLSLSLSLSFSLFFCVIVISFVLLLLVCMYLRVCVGVGVLSLSLSLFLFLSLSPPPLSLSLSLSPSPTPISLSLSLSLSLSHGRGKNIEEGKLVNAGPTASRRCGVTKLIAGAVKGVNSGRHTPNPAKTASTVSDRQHVKSSEQIRPRDVLACCWDVKKPTDNKQRHA